jgi:uncharacterized protein (DUF608 family)
LTDRVLRFVIALTAVVVVSSICIGSALGAFHPETGAISSERWRSGVPLGGIGVGKIEVLTDGAFGYFTINHNWDRPTDVVRGCFGAVFADDGAHRAARLLRLGGDEEYDGAADVASTEYHGWFPEASVGFTDPELPVNVGLYAWSPLIPHNVKDSSLPVACFEYTLANPGERPAVAAVAVSWENLLGWGGRRGVAWESAEGNRQIGWRRANLRGLRFTTTQHYDDQRQNVVGECVLAAEAGPGVEITTLDSWDAAGRRIPFWDAFAADGSLPAPASPAPQRPAGVVAARVRLAAGESRTVRFWFVWHMPNHITVFQKRTLVGGSSVEELAGVELALDSDLGTRWSTNRPMLKGDTFEIDFGTAETIGRVVLDAASSANDYPHGYRVEVSGDDRRWRRVASATGAEAERQQQRGRLDIVFQPVTARYLRIVNTGSHPSWFWSIHELNVYPSADAGAAPLDRRNWRARAFLVGMRVEQVVENVGHYYSKYFRDAPSIAAYVSANRDRLLSETRELRRQIERSNLPFWLQLKLINCTFPMYANTILTRDGRFAVQESPVDMGGALGTMDQRMAAHAFYLAFFPELDRSELEMFARCQDLVTPVADGRITHFDGNLHEVVGNPNVGYGITDWPDLTCSWVMQVSKWYRWNGDRALLDRMWPHVQRAMDWLEKADTDGDGIPEGGSTYDYETLPRGAFSYNASSYLGALKAAAEMARVERAAALERHYRDRVSRAQRSMIDELWNGEYFIKWRRPHSDQRNPNSFIAALAGDWLSRLDGLGRVLPADYVHREVEQVLARHVRAFHPVPPMEVTPEGRSTTDSCYLLQHEPYVGCESIYEGFTDDGLDVIRRVYECSWELNQNPWHQSLAYDAPGGAQGGLVSYMTCPTSWHVISALSGASMDVSGQALYLSPRVATGLSELHMPVFLSRCWLWLDYVPARGRLTLRVLKAFGEPVTIREIRADGDSPPWKLKPVVCRPQAVLDLSAMINPLHAQARPEAVAVKAPTPPRPERPGLSSVEWRATAGAAGGGGLRVGTGQAYDGDPSTRWTTMRPMRPGDWYQFDLGGERTVRKLVLDSEQSPGDYPRGYRLDASRDGKQWHEIASATAAEVAVRQVKGVLTIEFAPLRTRYLRITQLGEQGGLFWSIHELYVYQ